MKKYFVVETDEMCNFGDVINLTMFKELENGKVTVEKEVEFNENTMNWMLEMGFVEEREVEDEEDLLDFDKPCETLVGLIEDFEALEKRVEALEKITVKPKKNNG